MKLKNMFKVIALIAVLIPGISIAALDCANAPAHESIDVDMNGYYVTQYNGAYFIPQSEDCSGYIVDFRVKNQVGCLL